MKAVNAAGIVLVALLSHGCVREEIAVPAQPRYAVECVARVGPTYDHQLWFDLSSYSVVAQNSKMDWDLAFESAPEGWRVRLNQARLMRAHRAWEDAIGQPGDTAGFGNTWRVDLPSGRPDSVAIPDWRNDQPVFILNLGYGTAGQMLGLRKLQITSVDASAYQFTLAHMDGSNVQHHSVQKDPARAYTHFSISNGTVVIAPPLGSYDIVFTQYTEQFYYPDPYQSYLVTGTVNGYSGARVAQVQGDFASVSLNDTLLHPFSTDEDVIGYDWKDYSFDTGAYEVDAGQVYIVQDRDGLFYKLHFTDYYDEQGMRGSPRFAVMPL